MADLKVEVVYTYRMLQGYYRASGVFEPVAVHFIYLYISAQATRTHTRAQDSLLTAGIAVKYKEMFYPAPLTCWPATVFS